MDPNQMPPLPASINVGLSQTKQIDCPSCEGIFFRESILLRRLPGALQGKKKDDLIPIGVFRCEECGEVLKEFLPPGLTLGTDEPAAPVPPKSSLIL